MPITALGDNSQNTILINQVYGQGSAGTNAISHGFIELYNTTNKDIELDGMSLQLSNGGDDWHVLPLTDQVIPALSSFLVVSTDWHNDNSRSEDVHADVREHRVRYVIEAYDMEWDVQFSNSQMSVILAEGHEALELDNKGVITENERVIDLVGAVSTSGEIANSMKNPASSFSRQSSLRRINLQNTGDNEADFERVDFRLPSDESYDVSAYVTPEWNILPARNESGITDNQLESLRPRYSGDGEWSGVAVPLFAVSVKGTAAEQTTISPAEAQPQGTPITVTVTPPYGQHFAADANSKITVPGLMGFLGLNNFSVTVAADRLSASGEFIMPAKNVELTVDASFSANHIEPNVLINQVYGQGSPGANAISHGFIELYNPTHSSIDLNNYSLQILNGARGSGGSGTLADDLGKWLVLPLRGEVIPARSSFLVVSTDWYNDNSRSVLLPQEVRNHRVRHVIRDWDLAWDVPMSNNHLSVALVHGDRPLSNGNNEVTARGTAAAQATFSPAGTHPYQTPMTMTVTAPFGKQFAAQAGDVIPLRGAADVSLRVEPNRHTAIGHFNMPVGGGSFTINQDLFEDVSIEPNIIINQIANDFIELFNPTDQTISMGRYSLQVFNADENAWRVMPLTARSIPARSSYLVAHHDFDGKADMRTHNIFASPMSVAIVHGTSALLPQNGVTLAELSRLVDYVSDADFSENTSIRRKDFQNTRNNSYDFEQIDFRLPTEAVRNARPRTTADGAYTTPSALTVDTADIMIRQVNNSIELYNPTSQAIALDGFSLQVLGNNTWQVLPLAEQKIAARSSFLVAGKDWKNDNYDMEWEIELKNIVAALVTGDEPLQNAGGIIEPSQMPRVAALAADTEGPDTPHYSKDGAWQAVATSPKSNVIDPEEEWRIIDLVGAVNEPDIIPNFWGEGPATGISRNVAIRRRGSFRNTHNNRTDFERIDYRLPSVGEDTTFFDFDDNWGYISPARNSSGITEARLLRFMPRFTGSGAWPDDDDDQIVMLIINGSDMARTNIHPSNSEPVETKMTVTITAPEGYRFVAPAGTPLVVTGMEDVEIFVTSTRLSAVGTFEMPRGGGTITAVVEFEPLPVPTGAVVAGLTITDVEAVANDSYNPTISHFTGTTGVYGPALRLTAWDDNKQVLIGTAGTERTPIVFNNASLLAGNTWRPAWDTSINHAPAFQIRVPTSGFKDLRLYTSQKSTGSGPDEFVLAYRVGSEGEFTHIPDSTVRPHRIGNDTYSALQSSYWDFALPEELDNQPIVYLRAVFSGSGELERAGNTSINDIVIRGTVMDDVKTFILNPNPVTINNTHLYAEVEALGSAVDDISIGEWSPPLPEGVTVDLIDDELIIIEGVRPLAGQPDIIGTYRNTVTREGLTTELVVNVNLTAPPAGILLAEIVERSSRATAINTNIPEESYFGATGGFYWNTARLTAWDDNTQIRIGTTDRDRTPIVIENNAMLGTNDWRTARDVGLMNAPAFQLQFSTEGFTNVRFYSSQKSTNSGPDEFILAYRVGDVGDFIPLPDSSILTYRDVAGDNTYAALESSYDDYLLPEDMFDKETVYLRVIFNGVTSLIRNGNTSINDIALYGDSLGKVLILTPNPATLTDDSPSATVEVSGVGDADITIGEWSPPLPSGVTAQVVGGSIVINGIRPVKGEPNILDTFTTTVTCDDITAPLTLHVNLTSPPTGLILASLTETSQTATAVNNSTPAESHFVGNGGLFGSDFRLTAWDNNTQRLIGFAGTARTPIVYNNASLASTNPWRTARNIGILNAPAFQMSFKTTGYENIRFSASQKSTGSGPDEFILAYRIGDTGPFTEIQNSTMRPVRVTNDTYGALRPTYTNFALPVEATDKETVQLRVIFNGPSNLARGGNTSINDIIIYGDEISQRFSLTAVGTAAAQTAFYPTTPQSANMPTTITVTAPVGKRFASSDPIAVTGAVSAALQVAANRRTATATVPMPIGGGSVTVNADFEDLEGLVINQIYSRAFSAEGAFSHGFVELYNASDTDFSLAGKSLQVQNVSDGAGHIADPWFVFDFSAEIATDKLIMPPKTSFLIATSQSAYGTRHNITDVDGVIDLVFSNRNISVALVNGTAQLSELITASEMDYVIDLVGAWNNNNNERDRVYSFWGEAPASRISNQEAARRIWVSDGAGGLMPQNTGSNVDDFHGVRYGNTDPTQPGISDEDFAIMKPRSSAEGALMFGFGMGEVGELEELEMTSPGALVVGMSEGVEGVDGVEGEGGSADGDVMEGVEVVAVDNREDRRRRGMVR